MNISEVNGGGISSYYNSAHQQSENKLSRTSRVFNSLLKHTPHTTASPSPVLIKDNLSEITRAEDPKKLKLREAAQMMESLMIKMVLKSMKETIHKTGLIDGGRAEEIFDDMLSDQYAESFSKHQGFGLADAIYQQYEKII